ncbi:ionotropic receptor 21a [Agrilus planipennis]|uniref:Ionotropic receptor 21a n=1 Tax=Agrilus planipennis TaxID=224129 RepID=A0A7F5R6A3_AGRPL|nr:ionotropic receptor 21a [Agrilus planipennis]
MKTYPFLLDKLLREFSFDFVMGQISEDYKLLNADLLQSFPNKCVNYVLFVYDIMKCKHLIGIQHTNKVVIVSSSSQWRVHEFLHSDISHSFVNVLVVTQSDKIVSENECFTSFIFKNKRNLDNEGDASWDGVEVRLIKLIGTIFNFTTDFREANEINTLGQSEAVIKQIIQRKANLGIGGIYVTDETISKVEMSQPYTQDCAAFISLTSTAMPRWRAIMGPFHWTVWLILTLVYLLAIFPLSFSDRHSLKYLFRTPEEMENMFWYVFGTFTNCFTFKGKRSWTQSHKYATRILIGFYWIFTIIITSCYTGSIIAFVTLPTIPETTDTAQQFLSGHYQIGTLDKGGWQHWFNDTTDPVTQKLLKNLDLVPTVEDGLKNTTKAFFWPYAFLGSKAQLNYIVRTSFTTKNKRALLHIAKECFVPFGVSIIFNKNENYREIVNKGLLRAVESGFLVKFTHDVEWDMIRSSTGRLLQANSGGSLKILIEDRALTLKDTEGMFLLLGFGIILGGISLLTEWLGGCFNLCRRRRLSTSSLSSNPFSFDDLTPREKIDSIASLHYREENLTDKKHEKLNTEEMEDKITDYDIKECFDKILNFSEKLDGFNDKEKSNEEGSKCDTKVIKIGIK